MADTTLPTITVTATPIVVRGLFPQPAVGTQQTNLPLPGTASNPNFTGQITFEENHHDDMEIVDHPIEQGAPITDHSFKRPADLTVHMGWSVSAMPQSPDGLSETSLKAIYGLLLTGQANRTLYTVITGKRRYTNMSIKTITLQTDAKTENALMITLTMRQLILVSTRRFSVTANPSAQASPDVTNPPTDLGTQYLTSAPGFQPENGV